MIRQKAVHAMHLDTRHELRGHTSDIRNAKASFKRPCGRIGDLL